jgi:tetratricopeptide (TPR) repeat protein
MTTRQSWLLAATIVLALALAASANSVVNGFVYDDTYIVVKAARHSLDGWWRDFGRTYWPEQWGGDGYRPLTVIAFRIEWVLGGGKPFLFHAVNVGLHAFTAVAVFWMAGAFLPFAAAFVVAALYAVHPVHVEAIANVVGQSELWVALLATLAVGLFIHGRRAGAITWPRWAAIGALYLAACFFKEHAIVLPALLALAELTVVSDSASLRERLVRMRMPAVALAAAGLAYFLVRSSVVLDGGSGFVPFLPFQVVRFTGGDRVLTAVGVAPEWLRLLLWPARLTAEYSPQYVEIAQGPSIAQLPGLLVLLGTLGLCAATWRRNPATAFGIGWLVLTLLPMSNFIIPAGFIVAERTLLLPSVGVMIAVGSAVPWLYERFERRLALQRAAGLAFALLVVLGIARSYGRNQVWHDEERLFRQSVVDSPDSYRAHYILGSYLFQQKRKNEGEQHLRRALQLFPYDPVVMMTLAEQYRGIKLCAPAIELYRIAQEIAPSMRGHLGLAVCLLETLELDEAKRVALNAIRWSGNVREARSIIAAADAGRDSLTARRARGDTIPRSMQ